MKKIVCIAALLQMILFGGITAVAEQTEANIVDFKIEVNEKQAKIKNPILAIDNYTYLPLREMAELFNLYVAWDGDNHLIKISNVGFINDIESNTLKFKENIIQADTTDFKIKLNGYVKETANPIVVVEGISYLPVREISQMLGFEVDWNEKYSTVIINGEINTNDAPEDEERLYPFSVDGIKYGYMDKTGEVKIEPQYNYAYEFNDGLACVGINEDGEPHFEGLGKYGFINLDGELVIPMVYDLVDGFSDGFAVVKDEQNDEKQYYYINKKGERVFDKSFATAWRFQNGIAEASENGEYRYIDINGEYIEEFNGQYFIQKKGDYFYGDSKIFDEEYNVIFDLSVGDIGDIYDNKYVVVKRNKKMGVIDLDENVVIDFKYDELSVENDFLIAEIDGKAGIIDFNGNIIIDFKYDTICYEDDMLYRVYNDKKVGYIDINDNIIIPFVFEDMSSMYYGRVMGLQAGGGYYDIKFIDMKNKNYISIKESAWGVEYVYPDGVFKIYNTADFGKGRLYNESYIMQNGDIIVPKL